MPALKYRLEYRSDIDKLWQDYKASGDIALRNELLEHYSPLAHHIASHLAMGLPPSIEREDLVSYGIFGLLDAIDKFDLERGIKFETYATLRVRGAIIDEMRSVDWVPRTVRAKSRTMERTRDYLNGKLRREPTYEELREEMDMSEQDFRSTIVNVYSIGVVTLHSYSNDGPDSAEEGVGSLGEQIADVSAVADGAYEIEGMKDILAAHLDSLEFREILVLTLYYYEGLTLAEIGTTLGVTESRICQIHTKSIEHLCTKMRGYSRET